VPDTLGPDDGRLPMNGFAGVMALVLMETVAGASVLTWASALWRETKRSFFTIWTAIMTVLFAWPAWWSARAGALPGDTAATNGVRLALATAVVLTIATVCLLIRWRTPGRVAGIVATVGAIATLLAFAPTGRQGVGVSAFQLLAGAAFLGASYDALFLGHWYLTDRKLTRAPINRFTMVLIVATCVEIVAIITGGFEGTASSRAFNPLLTSGALAPWIAIGMAGTTLLVAVLARAALKGDRPSAVQSATGFFYLSLVTAFTAEIAVTTRFFPT
jgi:hypothetical protein